MDMDAKHEHGYPYCNLIGHRWREIDLRVRWPWPLFRLLAKPLDASMEARKNIAAQLLREADANLECTTLKIKKRCRQELEDIQETGQLKPGTCLHGILAMTALQVKLDSGALESLNSMIKVSMAQANNSNMSLELLSSRVNTRKTVTMLSGGSTRLKDVKPVAEEFARSSILYQGKENEVLSEPFRWSPPEPKTLPEGNVQKHNPALVMSSLEKYAVRFHSQLVKQFHAARSESAEQLSLLLGVSFQTSGSPAKVFLLAELSAKSSWWVALCTCNADGGAGNVHQVPTPLDFQLGVKTIAQQIPENSARPVNKMSLVKFQQVQDACSGAVVLQVTSTIPVLDLKAKRVPGS